MRALLVLLMFTPCLAACFDTNGDGVYDVSGTAMTDNDNDGSFDGPGRAAAAGSLSDSVHFAQAWTSGSVLNNQWDACCGYFDDDSLLDILGHHWSPNVLHVFESDGAGGYEHVWEQTESLPPGSYCTVSAGDPDDDGDIELLGGEVSTLGKVVIMENVADDSWGLPYCGITRRNQRIRTVRVGDTNRNDTNEVIVVTGDVDGGTVAIYEHTGAPGVHAYTMVYEYTTVSYLFQAEVGDADNDGYPEVLLGVGGWHGFPMNIRRIVYDPASRTYSHKMFTSAVIGLPIAPMASALDSSGENRLVTGSSGDPNGQMHVFKYTSGDSFAPLWSSSSIGTSGNVIAVTAARLAGIRDPLIFGAPFGGAVYGFAKDDTAFHCVTCINPGTGAAIRSIDHGIDIRDELVLAESAPADFVSVYRRETTGAVGESRRPELAKVVSVRPNPSNGPVTITCQGLGCRAFVYDAQGALVTRVKPANGSLLWNLVDQTGRRVRPGVYLIRCETPVGAASAKLVLTE